MRDLSRDINIEDYDYELPEDRIAQYPVMVRDNSQLLLYNKGNISRDKFKNITKYLPAESLLVFNNTKVIRARLIFKKDTGANIEVFCLEPFKTADYQKSFSSIAPVEWKCMIGNLKKWKNGILTSGFQYRGREYILSAERLNPETGGAWRIRFRWEPDNITFGVVIENIGHIPLPPYVKREDEEQDYLRYQTVYSKINGSVAAPTAGLHFTEDVLDRISNNGIKSADVTLHVGAGTFQPVKTKDISKHEMHSEYYIVTKKTVELLLQHQDKIIAVGTTSVRTLESLYWLGVKIKNNPDSDKNGLFTGQWEPYEPEKEVTLTESLGILLDLMGEKRAGYLEASTKIMIIPGYKFRVISGMITNFHQPKSTLLLLISAWVGRDWQNIYNYALGNGFRFLSYGDCSLLVR
ncbi:MAG: S-adenosylmethionine:tRNA ribosyltransferase-isomerase [Bacteroidales bacterium]|jgi:S-adenosylmethionine:tRNA ribosyltransferase-isomerase|nr:S-adenosylmethionine:tRNA ribosyltransferase-isomerase [Bacteroidales bacterium]